MFLGILLDEKAIKKRYQLLKRSGIVLQGHRVLMSGKKYVGLDSLVIES